MRPGFQPGGCCDQMKGMLSDERDLFSPHIKQWEYLKGYVLQGCLKGMFNKFHYYFSASLNINITFPSHPPCFYDWVLTL